ncbi:MAG: NAD(P)H-dependent oxidoreductase, partial [Thermomicrobiales bacterium]
MNEPHSASLVEPGTTTKLGVIIASTRPGRIGLPIGTWIAEAARAHGAFDVTVLDLAEIDLPMMDEPNHPRMHQYTKPHTIAWSEAVAAQDAFVVVMPEYNFSFTAPLKNAIDYLFQEWAYKPVALASYGGVSGGLRAAQQFKQVVTTLNMMPIKEAVALPFAINSIKDGVFVPTDAHHAQAATMFTELQRWAGALAQLRVTS